VNITFKRASRSWCSSPSLCCACFFWPSKGCHRCGENSNPNALPGEKVWVPRRPDCGGVFCGFVHMLGGNAAGKRKLRVLLQRGSSKSPRPSR